MGLEKYPGMEWQCEKKTWSMSEFIGKKGIRKK